MGTFGGLYKGDKKKIKKSILEKKAQILSRQNSSFVPKVEIIKKGKNDS